MKKWRGRWRQKPSAVAGNSPVRVAATPSGLGGIVRSCSHRGNPVRVGPHTVFAGGTRDLREGDLAGYDLVIPLTGGSIPLGRRERAVVWSYELQDYGGVPADWVEFLQEAVVELRKGQKIIAFCMGSHGRTGTFLASLVSILEPATEDPIAAVRARHCRKAVETRAQAEAVFALRGKPLPAEYGQEFQPRVAATPSWSPSGFTYPANGLHSGAKPWWDGE